MTFRSHGHHFKGDPDKIRYTMGLIRTWLEHPDESQRKSKVTHSSDWPKTLNKSPSLKDWDQFKKALKEVYGDKDRRLNTVLIAYGEMSQGHHEPDESVRDFEGRIRSNWRKTGWKVDEPSVREVL